MSPITLSVLALITFIGSLWGVNRMRMWGQQNMLDMPGVRSSHAQPMPRGGGLPIAVAALVAGAIVVVTQNAVGNWHFLAYGIGATLIAAISWLDDLRSVSFGKRLAVQAIATIIAIIGVGYFNNVTLIVFGPVQLGWIGVPITFFWIMGLTNAYNFMDGIDGLAGAQAVLAGVGWLTLGMLTNIPVLSTAGLLIAAAALGFLVFNWPPARIFMGDVGSTFLGFTFAVMVVYGSTINGRLAIAGALLVWVFVLDAGATLLLRMVRRENIFQGHRQHLYQRLVIAGYNHRTVTFIYLALAAVGLLLAVYWTLALPGCGVCAVLVPAGLFAGLWFFVVRTERSAQGIGIPAGQAIALQSGPHEFTSPMQDT